jgi:hypothetical protein
MNHDEHIPRTTHGIMVNIPYTCVQARLCTIRATVHQIPICSVLVSDTRI